MPETFSSTHTQAPKTRRSDVPFASVCRSKSVAYAFLVHQPAQQLNQLTQPIAETLDTVPMDVCVCVCGNAFGIRCAKVFVCVRTNASIYIVVDVVVFVVVSYADVCVLCTLGASIAPSECCQVNQLAYNERERIQMHNCCVCVYVCTRSHHVCEVFAVHSSNAELFCATPSSCAFLSGFVEHALAVCMSVRVCVRNVRCVCVVLVWCDAVLRICWTT